MLQRIRQPALMDTSYYKVCYWRHYIEQMNNRDTVDGSKNPRDSLELLCQTAVFKQILITSKTKQAVSRSFYSGHSSVTVDIGHSSHTLDSGHRSNTIV